MAYSEEQKTELRKNRESILNTIQWLLLSSILIWIILILLIIFA